MAKKKNRSIPAMMKAYFSAGLVFIGLDFVWLGFLMSGAYSEKFGYLANLSPQGTVQFNLVAGLAAQLAIIGGITAVLLKINPTSFKSSCYWGAILGFTIYAAYDLTNLSFVKGWPLDITAIDIAWGTFQGAVAGAVVKFSMGNGS